MVEVRNGAGEIIRGEYTGLSGLYNITVALPQGTYYVTAYSFDGYVGEMYDDISCAFGCEVSMGTPIVITGDETVSGIDFALDLAASISGTVTDEQTGAGITGLHIYFYDQAGEWVTGGSPDESGNYTTWDPLIAGTYYAVTSQYQPLGYLNELYDDLPCHPACEVTNGTPIQVAIGDAITGIDFALSIGASIAGTVIDGQTQEGIQDVHVDIHDAAGEFVTWANTEADGSYVTAAVLPEGTYFASTWNDQGFLNELYQGIDCASGCDVTTGDEIVVGPGARVTGIDFALSKASLIVGEVTDAADGAPLQGVRVYVFDEAGNFVTSGMSDPDGRYETTSSIPAGVYYAYSSNSLGYVDEVFEDMPCDGICHAPGGTPIEVLEGLSTTVDFALDKGGTIAGTVTDQQTGSGLHRIYIVVFDSDGKRITEVGTDTNGMYYYSRALPPGDYFVRTYNKSGYINEVFDNIVCLGACDVTAGIPISIGLGEDVTGIDFALAKGATISGTITDSATSAPLPGVSARIYDENCNYRTRGRTDEEGNYTSEDGLVPGQHYVVTDDSSHYVNEIYDNVPWPYGCEPAVGLAISVSDGEAITGIDFRSNSAAGFPAVSSMRPPVAAYSIFRSKFSMRVDNWSIRHTRVLTAATIPAVCPPEPILSRRTPNPVLWSRRRSLCRHRVRRMRCNHGHRGWCDDWRRNPRYRLRAEAGPADLGSDRRRRDGSWHRRIRRVDIQRVGKPCDFGRSRLQR